MSNRPRRDAQRCSSCSAVIETETAFLSSRGVICDACHRDAKVADKSRNRQRESNVDALMMGIFALSGAVGLAVVAFLNPVGVLSIRLLVIFIAITFIAAERARRLSVNRAYGRWGRRLAFAGAILGVVSVIAIGLELFA